IHFSPSLRIIHRRQFTASAEDTGTSQRTPPLQNDASSVPTPAHTANASTKLQRSSCVTVSRYDRPWTNRVTATWGPRPGLLVAQGSSSGPLRHRARAPRTFLAHTERTDVAPLPKYVVDTFEHDLECGDLARGFLRCRCAGCGHDVLVAFACKG